MDWTIDGMRYLPTAAKAKYSGKKSNTRSAPRKWKLQSINSCNRQIKAARYGFKDATNPRQPQQPVDESVPDITAVAEPAMQTTTPDDELTTHANQSLCRLCCTVMRTGILLSLLWMKLVV